MEEDHPAPSTETSPPNPNRSIKILLSRHHAGAIIGKAGVAVNELQSKSGARIKVSHTESTFPETQFRIVMLEGTAEAVAIALKGVCETCFTNLEAGPESQMMLAVPSAAAPVIIGKGGVNIEEMGKRTGTTIRMSNRDREVPGVKERIATIKGTLENVVQGCIAVVEEMHKDARFSTYDNPSTNYDQRGSMRDSEYRDSRRGGFDPRGAPRRRSRSRERSARSPRDAPRSFVPSATTISVQVSLPDDLVGLMLGRGGENLAQIQSLSRTKISVSRRGEFVEGTKVRVRLLPRHRPRAQDRIVTISGNPYDCELARDMLAKRVLEKQQQQHAHQGM
jgi:transcription antitermination factor NusA-like protein